MPQKEVTNLTKLNIYEVTAEQYASLLESSEFDENAIYLTPNSGGGGGGTTIRRWSGGQSSES